MYMGRITFTADAHHEDIIDDVESEDGVESRSEAVRECITRYADLQQRESDLQQRANELEQELARVKNEKKAHRGGLRGSRRTR
jgi:predicted  nucleic acid-binding Zn-ribbon protein